MTNFINVREALQTLETDLSIYAPYFDRARKNIEWAEK